MKTRDGLMSGLFILLTTFSVWAQTEPVPIQGTILLYEEVINENGKKGVKLRGKLEGPFYVNELNTLGDGKLHTYLKHARQEGLKVVSPKPESTSAESTRENRRKKPEALTVPTYTLTTDQVFEGLRVEAVFLPVMAKRWMLKVTIKESKLKGYRQASPGRLGLEFPIIEEKNGGASFPVTATSSFSKRIWLNEKSYLVSFSSAQGDTP